MDNKGKTTGKSSDNIYMIKEKLPRFSYKYVENYLYIMSNEGVTMGITVTNDKHLAVDFMNKPNLKYSDGAVLLPRHTQLESNLAEVSILITDSGDIMYSTLDDTKHYALEYTPSGYIDLRCNKDNLYVIENLEGDINMIKNPSGATLLYFKEGGLIKLISEEDKTKHPNINYDKYKGSWFKDTTHVNSTTRVIEYNNKKIVTNLLIKEDLLTSPSGHTFQYGVNNGEDDYNGFITEVTMSKEGEIYETTINQYGQTLLCRKLYELENNQFKIADSETKNTIVELRHSKITGTYGVIIRDNSHRVTNLAAIYVEDNSIKTLNLEDYYTFNREERYRLKSVLNIYSTTLDISKIENEYSFKIYDKTMHCYFERGINISYDI